MRFSIFIILSVLSYQTFAQSKVSVIRVRKPKQEKCRATILGHSGGNIKKSELMMVSNIQVSGPCDYYVVSYLYSCAIKGSLKEFEPYYAKDDSIATISYGIWSLEPGNRFFIEKIKVKSRSTGKVFRLPDLKFKVVD